MPRFYPRIDGILWLNRISTNFGIDYVRDHSFKTDDISAEFGITFNFDPNGRLSINGTRKREGWLGREFLMNEGIVDAGLQPFKWLNIGTQVNKGHSIYYSGNPFLGESFNYSAGIDLQPGEKLSESISFNHAGMKNPENGGVLYDVNIINTRSTYQLNKYFFVRGIYQYNTVNKRQLVDLLASFTLIPGTVVQLGYGTLMEEGSWLGNEWRYDNGDIQVLKKSLFFKTSYRHVF